MSEIQINQQDFNSKKHPIIIIFSLIFLPPSEYQPVVALVTELSPNRQMDIPLGDVRIFYISALHYTVTLIIAIGWIQAPRGLHC